MKRTLVLAIFLLFASFVSASIACYDDSGCGQNGHIGSPFFNGSQEYIVYRAFYCHNPGTNESYCSYKETNSKVVSYDYANPDPACYSDNDCDDSDAHTVDNCLNTGEVNARCEHTVIACLNDSECNDGNPNTIDDCVNPGASSAYCSNEEIIVECYNDSDCDDGDSHTFDSCLNPGTQNSRCTHEQIECLNDSECNDSNPLTPDSCVNPGNVNSFCYHNVSCSSVFGDLDGDLDADVYDVNYVVEAALGIEPQASNPCADVDDSGAVDAVDVQRVINAVLGLYNGSFTPRENEIEMQQGGFREFSVNRTENPSVKVAVDWYLNNQLVSTGNKYDFDSAEIGSGKYAVKSVVKGVGTNLEKQNSWTIKVVSNPCFLLPNSGYCKGYFIKYYFDQEQDKCMDFIWGGCDGTVPFETLNDCLSTCGPK